jgi:predicted porin
MKKSLLALAALTAFAGAASAQSSVTLFGIVDLDLRNVKNGSAGSLNTLGTNGQASSRLGFRGVEDLGGGLRAGFWLEGDISPDVGGGGKSAANAVGNGADPMTWTRRATASLTGGFGEIRLGRDYTPTFVNISTYDLFGYVGVSTIANVRSSLALVSTSGAVTASGAGTAVRANNTVSYFLPAMGGLYGQLQYAFDEGAVGNKYVGGRIGYAAGPLNVSGAYGKTSKNATNADAGIAGSDLKVYNLGASFNLGFMTIQGSFEKSEYYTSKQLIRTGSILVPIGAGNLKFNAISTSGSSRVFASTLLGVGYVYDLSKRTSVYAGYGRIANGGNAAVGGKFTASSGGPALTKGGETSTGIDLGIRHNF